MQGTAWEPATRFRRLGPGRKKSVLDLTGQKSLGGGGAGVVFRDPDNPDLVVKIYLDRARADAHREKVFAMLDNPPDRSYQIARSHGEALVQIAWPQMAVETMAGEFAGFTMPLALLDKTRSGEEIIQRGPRLRAGLRDDYAFRITVGRNLASVICELNQRGHYVVDLHPGNLRVYGQAGFVCLLDTDGYSVVDGRGTRFPAGLVVDQIVCPEGQGHSCHELGEEQDRYALAVYLFQILNEGINPYQGVPRPGYPVPQSLVERIKLGLYAYGDTPNALQSPAPRSIHEWMEPDTRALFNRAFGAGRPRPSAAEWRDHFHALLDRLQPCAVDPTHLHFSKGCLWCDADRRAAIRLEAARREAERKRAAGSQQATANIQIPARAINVAQGTQTQPVVAGRWNSGRKTAWTVGAIGAVVVIGALATRVVPKLGTQDASSPPPAATTSTPAPTPPRAERPLAPATPDPVQTGLIGKWVLKGNSGDCNAANGAVTLRFEGDGSRLRFNGGAWSLVSPADAEGWRQVDASTLVRVKDGILQARDASVSGSFAEFQPCS